MCRNGCAFKPSRVKPSKAVRAERFNVPLQVWENKDKAIDAASVTDYLETVRKIKD